MGNNKNPTEKRPGEKEPGTFHYNPGNMSGKTIGADKAAPEESSLESRHAEQDKKEKKPPKANEQG